MYLKSLKAVGFKSFAEKTVLHFEPGITAIVGPNGCGKSNISDAIRWVLGEQSAKALRGGEMADVIFSGTEGTAGRRPLSMAEVSLTIGDVGADHLKAAGVGLEFNELTVTRRVFRDGQSEYFLNNTPCRLRDIQQLFLGTGIGRASYSIMAQGQITRIIQSKPADRRALFEEAAGITKFKQQKGEALRKLECTDQNLLRLDDIIREIKRQIGSLQRQAGKARRHQKLSEELRHLETQLARHEFDLAGDELRRLNDEAGEVRAGIEGGAGALLEEEAALRQHRHQLADADRHISLLQQRAVEMRAGIDRHQSRIQLNQERCSENASQREGAHRDIEEAQLRHIAADAELDSIARELADFCQTLRIAREVAGTRQAAVEQVSADARQCQSDMDASQASATTLVGKVAQLRADLTLLDQQKQHQIQRLDKLSAEKIQLEEERQQLEARIREFETAHTNGQAHLLTSRDSVSGRQSQLGQVLVQLEAVSVEVDELLRRQAALRSRHDVLVQLLERHEGFTAGARAVLVDHPLARGTLTSHLCVPPRYVAAIEAALGANLQAIFTDQPESAHAILESLPAATGGRIHLIALAATAGHSFDPASPLPEGALRALDVVEVAPAAKPAIGALLADTLIVEDLAAAARVHSTANGRLTLVTRAGHVLSAQGVYSGGSPDGSGPESILGRKNDIASLQEQLGTLAVQLETASRNKGALMAQQTEITTGLRQAQQELAAHEVTLASREGEHRILRHSAQLVSQKIGTVLFEIESLADQDRSGRARAGELQAALASMEQERAGLQSQMVEWHAAMDRLRLSRDEAVERLTEARVQLAQAEQREAVLNERRQPLEDRRVEAQRVTMRAQSALKECDRRDTLREQEDIESRELVASLQRECDEVARQAAGLVDQRNQTAAEAEGRDLTLTLKRNAHGELLARRTALEVALAQKEMTQRHLVERVLQKHQVDLLNVRSECITITITDNGQATVETLTAEAMTAGGAATNWNAVGERVVDLQAKIDALGPVNLVAISEYEEVEQRHTFLSAQQEDLVGAKRELMELIQRINKQSREMFTESFARIRENFRRNFPELFGGGKADLVLIEGDDVLESGVEIMAQPPGKQLRSISLLSGGEQTMTAVALLFSIYQVRPSPFCVLDELDAPLDDSNIERFLNKLRSFLGHSQFLVITHNKRTIAASDVLYGVTMQERGVSRIVSVRFSPEYAAARGTSAEPAVTEKSGNGAAGETEEVFLAK